MLKIYNTLTRKKEPFIPMEDGIVKMYVCGMTTYSDAHIGHARTYLAFDIIRRYLEYKGYEVFYVQNITDIDDKIIKAANEAGIDALKYSSYYTKRCLDDMKKLGIRHANIYPKASEHINDMIKMIEKLIDKKYAYVSNGDVYFSVEKFREYGKLSNQNIQQIKAGARIKPGEKKKKPEDFALWKEAKPKEPKWESPWGLGRPGWHIECSVMSSKYLGVPFDIHGGGHDLIFPHHENEIAQAEATFGKRFVNYWLHSGMLKVKGEKMSKSLGNIINVRDALKKWDAESLRFFFASYHYRSPADFNENALKNAENSLKRLKVVKDKLEELAGKNEEIEEKELDEIEKKYLLKIEEFKKKFEEAMDDDFNTPKAMESLFDFIKETNKFLMEKENPDEKLCRYALNEFLKIANVLTLFQEKEYEITLTEKGTISGTVDIVIIPSIENRILMSYNILNLLKNYDRDMYSRIVNKYSQIIRIIEKYGGPNGVENFLSDYPDEEAIEKFVKKDGKKIERFLKEVIEGILSIRANARKEKNYKIADKIRDELKKAGIEIEDIGKETKWRIGR